jgi:YidC/Oxa1 family membrane protein insertase
MWHTYIYQPLYNVLHLLIAYMPGHSAGLAIIAMTVIVRFAIYPLTKKAILAQQGMKRIEPKIKELKEKHKGDRQAEALAMMELYKAESVSPMGGCLPLLIQLPIIFALYSIFSTVAPAHTEVVVDAATTTILYSFVTEVAPGTIFLGIDLASKSILLALIVGITQYISSRLSLGVPKPAPNRETATFQDDMQHSMQMNMRYFLPIMMALTSWGIGAAVALYWVTTNLFTIGQELVLQKSGVKEVK